MKLFTPKLIALFLSCMIFMPLFLKLGWNRTVWSFVSKKLYKKGSANTKAQYNNLLWMAFVIIFNILVQLVFELMGWNYTDAASGIFMGFSLSFLPSLRDKSSS